VTIDKGSALIRTTPAHTARFAEAAENTVRKDRRINIRLSDHDLAGKFVEGQLVTRADR